MSAQEGTDQDIGNVVVDQLAVGFFAQDNKRLAKRSEATAGTEWLYAHSAGADFVRRGDNVKNKKRLWLSRSLPPAQTGCAASLAPYRPALAEAQRCQRPVSGFWLGIRSGIRPRFWGLGSGPDFAGSAPDPGVRGPFLTARF